MFYPAYLDYLDLDTPKNVIQFKISITLLTIEFWNYGNMLLNLLNSTIFFVVVINLTDPNPWLWMRLSRLDLRLHRWSMLDKLLHRWLIKRFFWCLEMKRIKAALQPFISTHLHLLFLKSFILTHHFLVYGRDIWCLVYIYCIYCDLMQIYVYGEYLN